MIKAGIIGGSNPMAGELIRLLVNHPDVEIMWVDSARYTGRLVSDVHHGLLGETSLRISPSGNNRLDEIDALFIFRHRGQTIEWLEQHPVPEGLRIIDLSVDMRDRENAEAYDFVYGLPELNRKALVRGATRAIVPHPAAMLAELALLPMAKAGRLRSPISVTIGAAGLGEQPDDLEAVAQEARLALGELQPDVPEIEIKSEPSGDDRVMTALVAFDSTDDIGDALRDYEEFYDDHSFTFVVANELSPKEVAGTNKCLLRLDKRDGRIEISATMDALLKGASGTGVHDMNLLFGLAERVGLALKASKF